jgi:hypothetical protein
MEKKEGKKIKEKFKFQKYVTRHLTSSRTGLDLKKAKQNN